MTNDGFNNAIALRLSSSLHCSSHNALSSSPEPSVWWWTSSLLYLWYYYCRLLSAHAFKVGQRCRTMSRKKLAKQRNAWIMVIQFISSFKNCIKDQYTRRRHGYYLLYNKDWCKEKNPMHTWPAAREATNILVIVQWQVEFLRNS